MKTMEDSEVNMGDVKKKSHDDLRITRSRKQLQRSQKRLSSASPKDGVAG
jgi:hypothetical protein